MIKAVIFDMGGVLAPKCWDTEAIVEITVRSLKEAGVKLSNSFRRVFRDILENAWFEIIKTYRDPGFAEAIRRALDEVDAEYREEQIIYAVERIDEGDFCIPHEKAEAVLKELKDMGLKIGVISNAPGLFPLKTLEKYGLDKYIDYAVTSYQVGVIKPHPKIFEVALENLGVNPHESIYVGDVPIVDVKGAKNIGMWSVLMEECDEFMRDKGCMEEVDVEPDFKIKELEEILDIVKKLGIQSSKTG